MALDKVVDSAVLDAGMKSVADAIRAKAGTTDLLAWPDGFKSAVEGIQTGGGGGSTSDAAMKDVNFYDYDGTLVASYTLAEAQALTAFPNVPTHDGLTFQGWNWSLEKIHALTRPMNVGAMYITDDGATRLHIRIAAVGRMTVPLYIGQTVANGVSIDWGDGSTAETLAGTGKVNSTHTYAEPGDYVISLMPQDGCKLSLGYRSSSYCVMGSTGNNGIVYCNMLQEVYIGDGVTSIGGYAFQFCYSLASVTIPDGVTSISGYAFRNCSSLSNITIPTGVTSIGDSTFSNCYSLASVTIPDGVTSIGRAAFQSCSSIANITIPTGVTSIGSYAFSNCSSIASVTIPDGVTSIGEYAFQFCYSLANITIPTGVTSIGENTFSNCSSLASVTITDGVTSIGGYAFSNCSSIASVTIPDGVTIIDRNAFSNCYGMRYYDFSAFASVPTLSNTHAFNKIPSDCQMLIPAALYDEWSTATNWATYASYMVAV